MFRTEQRFVSLNVDINVGGVDFRDLVDPVGAALEVW